MLAGRTATCPYLRKPGIPGVGKELKKMFCTQNTTTTHTFFLFAVPSK